MSKEVDDVRPPIWAERRTALEEAGLTNLNLLETARRVKPVEPVEPHPPAPLRREWSEATGKHPTKWGWVLDYDEYQDSPRERFYRLRWIPLHRITTGASSDGMRGAATEIRPDYVESVVVREQCPDELLELVKAAADEAAAWHSASRAYDETDYDALLEAERVYDDLLKAWEIT